MNSTNLVHVGVVVVVVVLMVVRGKGMVFVLFFLLLQNFTLRKNIPENTNIKLFDNTFFFFFTKPTKNKLIHRNRESNTIVKGPGWAAQHFENINWFIYCLKYHIFW